MTRKYRIEMKPKYVIPPTVKYTLPDRKSKKKKNKKGKK